MSEIKNEDKIRVAITGAGRIGRAVFRAFYEYRSRFPHVQLVAMNDPHDFNTLVHLLRYDSVHGVLPFDIRLNESKHTLQIGQEHVRLFASREPSQLPWADLQIDCVLECTGRFKDYAGLGQHVTAGAKRVVLSAPAKGDLDATVVFGANDSILHTRHKILSIGSCTTNALAPVLKVIQQVSPIEHCFFNTIHAYTKDQCLVDSHHSDLRRARAAGQSIIPTKTGAAKTISSVLPELDGRVQGYAVRVPTANVSLLDMVVKLSSPVTEQEIHAVFSDVAKQSPYIDVTNEPLVSCDFNHSPYSAVLDLSQTQVKDDSIRLVAWYDNEWAYAVRMLDMAQKFAVLQLGEGRVTLEENVSIQKANYHG